MSTTVDIPQILNKSRLFRWRDDTVIPPDFISEIENFLFLLEKNEVDYLLVGGVALLQYTEGRNTEDIDLILAEPELKKIPGYTITESNDMFATGQLGNLRIDIWRAEQPLFARILVSEICQRDFHGHSLRCVTPDGLVLLKLFALPSLYRQGQISRASIYESDVASLIFSQTIDLESVFTTLADHLSASDLREVKTIISEIEERKTRFQ